jgi:Domain of unknown function (DUF1835)
VSKREIQIAPGLSAAGSLIQAIRPADGDLLANQDVLSCGPVVPFESLDGWRDIRETYWREIYGADFSFDFHRDLLTNAERLRDVTSINLWIGVGAAEQLLLAWTVRLLRSLEIDPALLRVIQFVRDAKRSMDIWGLGLLNPEQLRAHPPPSSLPIEAMAELEDAWTALTSSEPQRLVDLLTQPASHLPYFGSSLRALLDRYPDNHTGLNFAERELLKYVKERGPCVTRVIGHTMGNNFGPDLWGDAWLFSRLLHLADPALPSPALSLSGNTTSMRTCEVELTETGNELLAGNMNFVELNGIDDWVLGVHLDSSHGSVWYRTSDSIVRGRS